MSKVTKGGPSSIQDADYYEVPAGEHVYSWSPDPVPGRSPATQVHLHFGEPPGNVFMVRFKSPRTLSALIHALKEHRDLVWPDICKTCDGSGVMVVGLQEGGPAAPQCKDCGGKGVRT